MWGCSSSSSSPSLLLSLLSSSSSPSSSFLSLSSSPPHSYTCSVLAELADLNCGVFLLSPEEVENKSKNSWDLIACATSHKRQSPEEAVIDLDLCLYVIWVLSLYNFLGSSSNKCGEEINAGFCVYWLT